MSTAPSHFVPEFFPADYFSARKAFLTACEEVGGRIQSYTCPVHGPEGRSLYCDTVWVGPSEPESLLVTISATHGVEGFCGSGLQRAWLEEGRKENLAANQAVLHIHAINPHGFAWLRRVTQENVDLNRNFIDFSGPRPVNDDYALLADAFCPRQWDDAARAKAKTRMDEFVEERGLRALQAAMTSGQYDYPDGVFFGGSAPTWSRRVLETIMAVELRGVEAVAVIDFHTGLGPYGYGELICKHAPDSEALARAQRWYDDEVTSPAMGTSTSAELSGTSLEAMERVLGDRLRTAIALEFGTRSVETVLTALRADAWLHRFGDLESDQGKAIKLEIRDALYPDFDDWKEAVHARGMAIVDAALRGLSENR